MTIMTWNAPIPKVIRSVSESFLEHSAPKVNRLFSGSAPLFELNLVIIVLDSRLCCFCQTKTNMGHTDRGRCE